MSDQDMKPCPFCGGTNLIVHESYAPPVVFCRTCRALGPEQPGRPVDAWNVRGGDDGPLDELVVVVDPAKFESVRSIFIAILDRSAPSDFFKKSSWGYRDPRGEWTWRESAWGPKTLELNVSREELALIKAYFYHANTMLIWCRCDVKINGWSESAFHWSITVLCASVAEEG